MAIQLTKWDPFKELSDFQHRLSSLFHERWNGGGLGEAIDETDWSPAVDISEDDSAYHISADLPEVKKDEVKVSVENDMLTITGERKRETEQKKKKFHRVERSYGKYVRSFRIPENGDASGIQAKFHDGVLNITLPKTETPKTKGVDVEIQ